MAQNANELVSKLQEQDVYSVICSYLYDMKQIPQYSTLSELCYLLDVDSFLRLIKYFNGQTITIPTKEEFAETIQILLLYQYAEVEKRPWKDALALAGFDSNRGKGAHNKLDKLIETFEKYNFGNRNY